MKKIFLGTFAAVALLFASCSSDTTEGVDTPQGDGGVELELLLGASSETKALTSGSVPQTTWANNVRDVRVFVADETGKVVYASSYKDIVLGNGTTYTWQGIPVTPAGKKYSVIVVANTDKSKTPAPSLTTYAGGVAAEWEKTVTGRVFATNDLYIGHKTGTLPAGYPAVAATKAFAPMSEVFVGLANNVEVFEGVPTKLTVAEGKALVLKREVSMLRVRINAKATFLAGVNFAHADCRFAIHKAADGMTFGLTKNAKDIYANLVNPTADTGKSVIVAATGNKTFKLGADVPATHTNGAKILNAGEFTYWNEFVVLPNLSSAEALTYNGTDNIANNNRKYYIRFAAMAPAGYVDDKGVVAAAPRLVYWDGTLQKGFVSNMIREANITITTKGIFDPEVDPGKEGGLTIDLGTLTPWDVNVLVEDIEV